MIKRLAHRNANVQLYTLEVQQNTKSLIFPQLTAIRSWRMRCPKIAVQKYIGNLPQEALPMRCCA